MNLCKSLIVGIYICFLAISCDKNDINANVEITGTIQKQRITTYQYGTHTISGYALRSNYVTLDDYVNQYVTVVGYKVEGYPLEGGPDLIEVVEIK